MQMETVGKSIFPWPSSPNLNATVLEVGKDLNFTMAVALQYRKIIVKVSKLKTLNAKIKLLKMLWSFMCNFAKNYNYTQRFTFLNCLGLEYIAQ